jgi:hypothetical protein
MPRPGCEGFSSFVPKGKKPEQSGARSSQIRRPNRKSLPKNLCNVPICHLEIKIQKSSLDFKDF